MFDPFKVLGVEKQYSLDMKVLEKRYFEEQKKTHPDRFIGAPEDKKREVLKQSSEVNQAYLLLKDPLQRALFLLEVEGGDSLAHDPAFLSEVMSWNERLESGEDLKPELHDEEKMLFKDLEDAFKEKNYERARSAHYRLTYVKKLLKDISLSPHSQRSFSSSPRRRESRKVVENKR